MEKCAAACVAGELEDGKTTVGTKVDIEHISATPLGMKPKDPAPFDTDLLSCGQTVFDVVYGHGETALIAAARATGCAAYDGAGRTERASRVYGGGRTGGGRKPGGTCGHVRNGQCPCNHESPIRS